MKTVVCFGEVMARLAPEGRLRFRQACPGRLDITFSGAEANVAASIAMLGGTSTFVSALPQHAIADACLATLRGLEVETRFVQRTEAGRLGIYFVEAGANQRPSKVIYDRELSSVSLTGADAYPWDEIFDGAGWLHVSGITPALSATAADVCQAAVQQAGQHSVTVSCDLNFRKNLWKWDASLSARALARKTMAKILPHVDVVIGNEEDASDVLNIQAGETDVHSGSLDIDRYPDVASQVCGRYANVKKVAITLRESLSATHNNWGAMLYDADRSSANFAPLVEGAYRPYEIKNIVDRVGGGDAFAAGLVFALNTPELQSSDKALAFAVAASCLAHSIKGDFNFSTRAEVEALMGGAASGRVVR